MQTAIQPVSVFPGTANTLYLRAGELGPPPGYYYELQEVTVVPPVAEQIDPVTGAVITPASPETSTVVVLKNGNVSMTEDQWNNWAETVDDTEYQLDCISANLALTRV